ncbi:MAG: hypothetical protein Q4D62_14775, partial [Planctomycetia bacterium]|nr:hypothetical protein [Planctomycetia bacterium]
FEKNNGRGIVNEVTSKKRSTLQGTIESYREVAQDDNTTKSEIGGSVYLVNPNGITMRKGFTFKGDVFGATTMSLSDTTAHLTHTGNTRRPEFYGVLINLSPVDADGDAKEQVFTISKGSLRLNKKGAISGGANFDLGEMDGFEATTPEGQNLRIGSVKLAKDAWITLDSGKNLTVRDITGTSYDDEEGQTKQVRVLTDNEGPWAVEGDHDGDPNMVKFDDGKYYVLAGENVGNSMVVTVPVYGDDGEQVMIPVKIANNVNLFANNRLRIRSVKDVDLFVEGENIRLSKSSSINELGVFTGGDSPNLSKFSIAKGTTVGSLSVTKGTDTKNYNGFTASKKITQKNYAEYLKERTATTQNQDQT